MANLNARSKTHNFTVNEATGDIVVLPKMQLDATRNLVEGDASIDISSVNSNQHVTHNNLGETSGMDGTVNPIFENGAKVIDPFTGMPINATGNMK